MTPGYKTITSIQFTNALWALSREEISLVSLRIYFACLVLVAVREAARRYRKARREKPKELARYRFNELERLTGLSPRAIKRALRQLNGAGLAQYSEGEIVIATEPVDGSEELLEKLSCSRSPKRPIPVPRSVLRFLARNHKEALAKTIIAYLVRGLSLARSGGEIFHKGTVKVSWIAKAFNLSERAVHYARGELVGLGWIERDKNSFQRKLNRDGAYFVINLNLGFTQKQAAETQKQEQPALGATATVDNFAKAPVKPDKRVLEFAPLPPEIRTAFAPPYKDKKTSNEVKNQKTQPSEPAGVSKQEWKIPNLRNITPMDLRSFGRLETLYAKAAQENWIKASEAMALNFISAAVRAREVGDDPARVFVTLVRRGLWHHITQAQEEYARRALVKFREHNPDRFRLQKFGA